MRLAHQGEDPAHMLAATRFATRVDGFRTRSHNPSLPIRMMRGRSSSNPRKGEVQELDLGTFKKSNTSGALGMFGCTLDVTQATLVAPRVVAFWL